MTMAWTEAEQADIAGPSRDVCMYIVYVGGGSAAIVYGTATDNWAVTLGGIVAVAYGLCGLLAAIGVLLMRIRAIRAAHADGGGGGGDV